MDWMIAVRIVLALAAGLSAGLIFFASLRQVTADYLGGHAVRGALLHFGRIAVLVALLFGAMQIGIAVLLAFVAGLVIARQIVVRRERAKMP